ncbi:hypothetical protein BC827DRAFT_1231451 [Russula dissimulans]|nr:hypothetical protein BC827DRAFT_1231451 [Russula dissimulans]
MAIPAVLASVVGSSHVSLGVFMFLICFLVYLSGHWVETSHKRKQLNSRCGARGHTQTKAPLRHFRLNFCVISLKSMT